jgi:hypothetical protein
MRTNRLLLAALSVGLCCQAAWAQNVIRNGSFEGSTAYWIVETKNEAKADAENPAFGSYALCLNEAVIRSASFPLTRGRPVKVSLSVRGEPDADIALNLMPSHREIAQKAKLSWNLQYKARAGKEWKRYSFTITPDVPTERSWWPDSVWILMIKAPAGTYRIDGVSVSEEGGEGGYLARRAVEVAADAPELPGYKATGNLLKVGEKVKVRATAYNTGDKERTVTLRWQLYDYEGVNPIGTAIDRKVVLPAGRTAVETAEITMPPGLVLARATALDETGKAIDGSDMPLTALAFPKEATRPDPRERFGGYPRGPHCVALLQKIGFRWSRWYPQLGWHEIQPESADKWKWPDEVVDAMAEQGFSINAVMYGLPKWAKGDKSLPNDMQWPADDKRWDDPAVQTNWDRYVSAIVKRYAAKSIVWEFMNEPDLDKSLDPAQYFALAKRTAALVRQADPKATFLVNCTWPGPTPIQMDFLNRGGARFIDVYSYHNYTPAELTAPDSIRSLKALFKSLGSPAVGVWFNEGWTYVNTSHDYPALPLTRVTPAEAGHIIARNMAELTAAGQEKAILFGSGYGTHGRSWWDWVGSGTELWDDHGDPTIAVAAWNVLIDQIGLSEFVQTLRPAGAVMHVFQDNRNSRGIAVAWATKDETSLELPLEGAVALNIVGQETPLSPARVSEAGAVSQGKATLKLPAGRKPFYVFTRSGISGKDLAGKLAALDEEAMEKAAGKVVYRPPTEWTGDQIGSDKGNPAAADGQPTWRFDKVWPDDPDKAENYKPMVWGGKEWHATEHSHGGQPAANSGLSGVSLSCRTGWPGQPGKKLAALTFISPHKGKYKVEAELSAWIWQGKGTVDLAILKVDKGDKTVTEIASFTLENRKPVDVKDVQADLEKDQELVFLPKFGGGLMAANFLLKGLKLTLQSGK